MINGYGWLWILIVFIGVCVLSIWWKVLLKMLSLLFILGVVNIESKELVWDVKLKVKFLGL